MFTCLKSITRSDKVQHKTTPSDCDILFWHKADSVCHLRCFVKNIWIILRIILKPLRDITEVLCGCCFFKSLLSFKTHISILIEETLSCQQYVLTDTISTGSTYFTTSLTEEQNPPQQKSTVEPCSLREKWLFSELVIFWSNALVQPFLSLSKSIVTFDWFLCAAVSQCCDSETDFPHGSKVFF